MHDYLKVICMFICLLCVSKGINTVSQFSNVRHVTSDTLCYVINSMDNSKKSEFELDYQKRMFCSLAGTKTMLIPPTNLRQIANTFCAFFPSSVSVTSDTNFESHTAHMQM